jgi:phenylacetate-CoA ligase
MAPGGGLANVKHRIRRANPMRMAMERTLTRMEHADAEQIRHYQERRLRMLIRVAGQSSPFYRDWFRSAGINPRDIQTLEDLGRLPLLTRRDLAERPNDFLVYPRRLMWSAKSSGTSGSVFFKERTRYWRPSMNTGFADAIACQGTGSDQPLNSSRSPSDAK